MEAENSISLNYYSPGRNNNRRESTHKIYIFLKLYRNTGTEKIKTVIRDTYRKNRADSIIEKFPSGVEIKVS